MSAEESIRRSIAAFGQYLDERRFEEWSSLFTEDAVFQHVRTRSEILAFMLGEELATIPELFRKHLTSNLIIDVNGNKAHVESDLVLFERMGELPWVFRFGKYLDDMVCIGEQWLFQNRQLVWTADGLEPK